MSAVTFDWFRHENSTRIPITWLSRRPAQAFRNKKLNEWRRDLKRKRLRAVVRLQRCGKVNGEVVPRYIMGDVA